MFVVIPGTGESLQFFHLGLHCLVHFGKGLLQAADGAMGEAIENGSESAVLVHLVEMLMDDDIR